MKLETYLFGNYSVCMIHIFINYSILKIKILFRVNLKYQNKPTSNSSFNELCNL